ncbi:hypothetical protein GQ457_15G022330 [Hibiscus cannabinus]
MAMASVYDVFLHHVFPSEITSETNPVPISQLQVELTLKFTLLLRCLDSVPLLSFPVTAQETLTFDLLLLHQRNQVHQVLAPVFTSLGIHSSYDDTMVDTIIRRGLEIAEWTFQMGFNCKVLHLESVIHATVEVSAPRLEFIMSKVLAEEMESSDDGMVLAEEMDGLFLADLAEEMESSDYGMVLAEEMETSDYGVVLAEEMESSDYGMDLSDLAEEMETSDDGMVPAQESSVREMVARVRVEEGDEDCTICLEGFGAGSYAARMPCSHIFHGECIQEWLKRSHYCPLCRSLNYGLLQQHWDSNHPDSKIPTDLDHQISTTHISKPAKYPP